MVSAAPVNDNDEGTALLYYCILEPLWAVFRDGYTDKAWMEEQVRRSSTVTQPMTREGA